MSFIVPARGKGRQEDGGNGHGLFAVGERRHRLETVIYMTNGRGMGQCNMIVCQESVCVIDHDRGLEGVVSILYGWCSC